nr:hypothetical protein [Tanacetum cinerariifolium]
DADDESSNDDDDDHDDKEEHLAPTDSFVVPTVNLVPSDEDTEAFETNESAPTPVPSPRRRTARMSIRPPTLMSATVEAIIGEIQLRVASPSTHHPSEIPSPPLLLPSTLHRDDTPKADMPLWKRARFTTPAFGFEVEEGSAAAAARHQVLDVTTMDANPGSLVSREVGYEIKDVWDDMVEDIEERAQTTVELEQKKQPLVLPPPIPARPPVLLPRDAVAGRPVLWVITLGGIIHTRENMGNVRSQLDAANNQRAQGKNQRVLTCFKCGAQVYFKKNYLKLRNKNQGNQAGNGNVVARAYAVGTVGTNPNSNVVTQMGSFDVIIGMDWLSKYHAGAAAVARAPYRLALFEMKELSDQLQEPYDKDFIRPSSSPWGALSKQDHEEHLKLILELLKKEELHAKFSKCKFWIPKVQFIGHVIDRDDENATNPPSIPPTQQALHTLSSIRLSILKKGVFTKDVNQKFLRSLPFSWSQVYLIMRTKPGVDTLSFDDLYNSLKVFKSNVKGSTASSSITQNVVFVSFDSTSSTNKDLEPLDEFDLEDMDLKWQVAMISMRLKKFYKKTGRKMHFDAKEPVGFDKTKDEPKAMVTIDGDGVDRTGHAEDDIENYALIAFNSSNLGSDTKVTFCSKECEKTYAKLKKLYDEKREQLGDASIEIQVYTLALKR